MSAIRKDKNVIFTHQEVGEYATIECVGQYLLAAHLINTVFAPFRQQIGVLVDFGCGAGKSTRAVAGSVRPGGRVIGVDVSEEFLRQAQLLTSSSSLAKELTFDFTPIEVIGEEEHIRLGDAIADALTTTIVLQEFQTEALLRSALREMGRISKAGAKLAAVAVSDKITCEDYTTFTYAPFSDNAQRADNVRKCQSTVSRIVWGNDRHWSKEIIVDGLQSGGWEQIDAEYALAPAELRPFPKNRKLAGRMR